MRSKFGEIDRWPFNRGWLLDRGLTVYVFYIKLLPFHFSFIIQDGRDKRFYWNPCTPFSIAARCTNVTVSAPGGWCGFSTKSLLQGGSPRKSHPLLFYIPSLTEKATLFCTLYWQMMPLSRAYNIELCTPFAIF